MAETKEFHLGDVLSAMTGILLSPRRIEGVYDILNWMTGESLYTHQLPRVSREAEPVLRATFPELAKIDVSGVTPENCRAWLDGQVKIHGEMFAVPKLNADQHERIDPLSELAEKVHPDRIIAI